MPKEGTMDWFDEFDDFEDEYDADTDMDDSLDDDSECNAEPNHAESQDDEFTARDVFFLGSAIGFGYEEGSKERKWRKRKRFRDDDSD
jgi:hypothetical protein